MKDHVSADKLKALYEEIHALAEKDYAAAKKFDAAGEKEMRDKFGYSAGAYASTALKINRLFLKAVWGENVISD